MEKDRTEYFRQYRLNHLEDYRRRAQEFKERQKQGLVTHDNRYYQTREELKEAEERGEGKINWDAWDRHVEEMKEKFKNMTFKPKQDRRETSKWVYQASSGKLLGHYLNVEEVVEAFQHLNLRKGAVYYYSCIGNPYHKLDLFFSDEPIVLNTNKVYDAKIPRLTAAYDLTTNQLIGLFKTATEAEEYFKMPKSQVGYCIRQHNGVYKKKNLRFEYQSQKK